MAQTRATPTVKRRRVGAQLRRYRDGAGFKTGDAAKALSWDAPRLSRTERGLQRVTAEDIAAMARVYGIEDDAALREITRVAEEPPDMGWWMPYRGLLTQEHMDFITLESEATTISVWHPTLIGGLLQTPDYAREIIGSGAVKPASPAEAERLVAVRMARQEVLTRPGRSVQYKTLVPEFAFHTEARGGPQVMRDQLRRLLDASKVQNVELQVVPLSTPPHPGSGSNFTILTFEHPWKPVVSVDHRRGGSFLDDPEDLSEFEASFELIAELALPVDESRDLITDHLERNSQ